MYAVIETGGKQYKVELGTELEVELLDVEPGQEINLERVLMVADGENTTIGQPIVADAAVSARVLRQDRGVKTISFKYRPKARRRVKKGHRQELTILKITEVRLGSKSAAAEAKVAEERPKPNARRSPRQRPSRPPKTPPSRRKLKAREKAAEAAAAPKKAAPAKAAPKAAAEKPAKAAPKAAAVEKPAKAAPKAAAAKAKVEKTAKADADAPAKRPARTKKDE